RRGGAGLGAGDIRPRCGGAAAGRCYAHRHATARSRIRGPRALAVATARTARRNRLMRFLFTTLQTYESEFYGRVGAALAQRGHEIAHVTVSRESARLLREQGF